MTTKTEQSIKSNKELAEVLIKELQHTINEDHFTIKFLDLIEEHFKQSNK